jgi:hypothetical protein
MMIVSHWLSKYVYNIYIYTHILFIINFLSIKGAAIAKGRSEKGLSVKGFTVGFSTLLAWNEGEPRRGQRLLPF